MYEVNLQIYATIYFLSYAAILLSFLWDYAKAPRWLVCSCVILCRLLVTKTSIWENLVDSLFPNAGIPGGVFYAFNAILLATLMLTLLFRASFLIILHGISTTCLFGFFITGFEILPQSRYDYTFPFMLKSLLVNVFVSFVICFCVRRYIIPLLHDCNDRKTWFRLCIPTMIATIGFFLLFYRSFEKNYPTNLYLGAITLFITWLAMTITNVKNMQAAMKISTYEAELDMSNELRKYQEEQYHTLSDSIEETRIIRHDLRH